MLFTSMFKYHIVLLVAQLAASKCSMAVCLQFYVSSALAAAMYLVVERGNALGNATHGKAETLIRCSMLLCISYVSLCWIYWQEIAKRFELSTGFQQKYNAVLSAFAV